MLSTFINRTKAFVGIIDKPNQAGYNNEDLINLQNKQLSTSLSSEGMETLSNNIDKNHEVLQGNIFDCIRTIQDPEKPATLEDLEVVYESGIKVTSVSGSTAFIVDIEFNPTVPHCSLATLIGLCMRIKVERSLEEKIKLDIHIKKGAHDTEDEINKQINDKERVAAAMENPNLRDMVEKCIVEKDM